MAKKPEPIVRLAAQTARQIFANSGNYMAFLTTAAHNFKYSFRDQLLIYAQKPDATACAETDFWNKHGRWVNKGTTGIALLVDTDKGYKLRHVFDMSDTNSRAGRTVPVWQMRPQYEGPVVEALENSYGEFSDKSDFAACLLETAKIIVEDNFGDYYADLCRVKEGSLLEELDDLNTEVWFKGLLENSVAYIMLTRCGIDPQEYFSGEDFARIYDFNTLKTLVILGAAASDIAEMPLREIASTVLPLYWEEEKQNRTFAQRPTARYNDGRTKPERSIEHGADIQNRGRLSTAQPGRAGGTAGRKIWDAAAQFPRQSPTRDLHGDAADRGAEQPSGGDRPAGHRDGGAADGANGAGTGRDREPESVRSDEVGRSDEQHQGIGGGNGAGGAGVRQLTDPLPAAEEPPQAPTAPSMAGSIRLEVKHHDFSAHSDVDYYYQDSEKNELLRTCDALKDHRTEIAAFFAGHSDSKERGDFIKSFFNNTYVEKILSNGQRAGYRAWDDVLTFWRGAYLSREKEVFMRWTGVADTIYGMILLNQWLDPDERPLPSEAEQISFIEQAEAEKASAFTIPQEAIDYILCGGSGISEGKYRIYEQFQKKEGKQENIKFLRDEYGIGGHSDAIPGSGYWEDHDGKGITISRDYGDPDGKFLLTWAKVEKRIGELIAADRYLNRAEKEHYPVYQAQVEERKARWAIAKEISSIIDDYVDFKTQLGEKEQCSEILLAKRCADSFGVGDKKCYVLTMEGSFVLPTLQDAMQTIIKDNTHLTERCEAMLAQLSGPLAAPLEPTYDELNPPPPPKKEYRFALGDTVYLGMQEYELLAYDEQTVRLFDPAFPIINKELPRAEFDRMLAENPLNDRLLQVVEDVSPAAEQGEPDTPQTVEQHQEERTDTPGYELGFGHLGNGVTVWNRLELWDGDYKTIAHIAPDRTVTYHEGGLPEDVRARIEEFAATSTMTISAVQDTPVFSTPPLVREPASGRFWDDYNSTKERYHDSLVLYQVGDFFELYGGSAGEDAQIAASELGLALTTRTISDIGRVSMCGFPAHALEDNVVRLTAAGHDVIVASLEDNRHKITAIPAAPTERAKRLINEFCEKEYNSPADFSNLRDVALAHSATGDGEHFVDVSADLTVFRLTYQVDGESVASIQCHDLDDLNGLLANLDFDEMIAFAEERYGKQQEQLRQQEQETDDFSDIDPAAIRAALAENGIVDGHVVDPDKLDANPFIQQVMADVEQIAANESPSPERFSVIETEGGYAVWDDIRDEIYVDGEGVREEFTSEWQAEDYLKQVKKAVADKEIAEWLAVERAKQEPAEKAADTEKGAESLADGHGHEGEGPAPAPPAPRRRAKVSPFVLHPEVSNADRHEYCITDDAIGAGTPGERFNNNVRAIRLLKKLEREDRFATPEEQAVLAQYVGWGGLADCFDERHSKYAELKALLDEDEYAAARESTLTAFYTPPVVIRSIYQALENMGFKTGNLLEPSCGIGNFIGMRPENLADSKVYGIELDGISGRIAQQLYQKSSIAVQGFEKTDLPDSFFDAAIGNVPFGSFKVSDKRYDKHNFLIHDYFFARTLDKVRPGGIIAFVTSKGTMDKETPTVRKYIAQRADLLGAIRLPNNAFKDAAGTEVTSDILFLQKRDALSSEEPAWVHLNTDENGLKMNQYFIDHPEMVMGEMREVSGPYGPETACLPREGQNLGEQLTAAIQNIQGSITEYVLDDPEAEGEDKSIPADPEVRNFSYTVVDGQVYYRENSRMNPVEVSVTAANRIKGLIGIRDCVRTLIEYQTEDWPAEDIQAQQKKLNALYDAFAAKYGRINSRANSAAFSMDSAYFLLSSLEVLDDERNFVRKADMFTKRTIKQKVVVTSVDTASEALAVSLAEKARVDMPFMMGLTGKTEQEVFADLTGVIFLNPMHGYGGSTEEKYLTADEYLSGNVREKLQWAKRSAEQYPEDYTANVEALERVQPVDLTASEISVRLGADWLPVEVVQQFMYELFDTPNYAQWNIKVHHSRMTRDWNIEGKSYDKSNIRAHNTYGTSRINGYKIIEETLNLRDVRIFDYVEDADGKNTPVLNKKETAIAQGKQELIKQAFQDWIWKDPARRERLTRLYNDKFNSTRPREYDGSHLNFVGMNPEITLRPHQVNAIAHILYGGNTLLAHVVGAGKTFEMVAAAQESKRLGLCQKSLFVVPNHLTEQWAAEYLQLYPSANILVATKKDFETKNRKRFCGRIATGDYDAIIIGHSQFEKIPVSIERQRYLLEQQRRDVLDGIAELKANHGERFSIKQMERTRKSIDAKLEKLNNQSRKDDVVTFEELGVDRIFIDEAHYYKNLASFSKMRNVGGISQTEAQKSSDLYMKCRYLDELTGGRGVIFATGTPISNTMVEMYTMQKYLQYGLLEQKELLHFDAWASTFGETVTTMELAPEGTGYRAKTRFSRFYNLPELMNMFKEVADIQTADMLNLPVPKPTTTTSF